MRHNCAIHCIGIGGVGLSALAQLLQERGNSVSGCDRNVSPTTELLEKHGIKVSTGQAAAHVQGIDEVIYSDAIPKENAEREAARAAGIPERSYFEALGSFANESRCLIAVSGAHGKTTTTAMLADVLEAAELDPTVVVGSLRTKTKSNFRAGGTEYFIAEADEYLRHFLNFSPRILVVLNIDADHLDYYKDLADIQSAFRELAQKIPRDGFLICDPAQPNVAPVLKNLSCTVVDYRKYFDPNLSLKVLSLNRANAAAVRAVADILKIDSSMTLKALKEFDGTWRRFEYKGTTENGAEVYDDYAHHPQEIRATLASVRQRFPDKKIIVAFHPHLYSRTKLLLDEFAGAFEDADEVLIAPIFAAREEPDPEISSEILAQKISERGTPARACSSPEAVLGELQTKDCEVPTVIVTMGAGDIYKIAEKLTNTKNNAKLKQAP